MLNISHWQPFEGGKLLDVIGLPCLPPERVTNFLYGQHHKVPVRPMAREAHVAADRLLGVGLGEVGGGA